MWEIFAGLDSLGAAWVPVREITGVWIWEVLTFLGHPLLWFVFAAALYWNQFERESFFLVNVLVVTSIITGVLKTAFARPRPECLYITSESRWLSALSESNAYSHAFPSGHAATISAVAAHYWSRAQTHYWPFLLSIGILIVGVSRVVLERHFLSDVIAGIIAGVLIGIALEKAARLYAKHPFKLTRAQDAAIIVTVLGIAVAMTAYLSPPALALCILGYYAGFFACAETGFVARKHIGLVAAIKTAAGFATLLIPLSVGIWLLPHWISSVFFVLAGFWVSCGFPVLFDRFGFLMQPKPLS